MAPRSSTIRSVLAPVWAHTVVRQVLLGLTALFVPLILGLAFAQGLSSLDEVLAQRDRPDASSRVD